MDTNEVLKINAALQNIINVHDMVKNAQKIISFVESRETPYSSNVIPATSSRTTTTSDEFAGDTGFGNMSFQTEDNVKERNWSHGLYKERVGHFKIWRKPFERGQCVIFFQNHWASEFATEGLNPSPMYCIFHTKENGDYLHFGILEKKVVFRVCIFAIIEYYASILHTAIGNNLSSIEVETELELFFRK